MYEPMQTLFLAAGIVLASLVGYRFRHAVLNCSDERTTAPTSDEANRRTALATLTVGDAVVVVGKAAAPYEYAMRTITAANRRYIWVGGHQYRRSDGWQADARGFESDVTWIMAVSDLAKAA